MKGIVKFINTVRGIIAIEVETNDITVAELREITCSVEVGDVITGNLDTHEGEELKNITKNETMDVYIQGVSCTLQSARDLMK